jgi:hypothetical protein
MKRFQERLIELETDAEHLLLARQQVDLSIPTNFYFEVLFWVLRKSWKI